METRFELHENLSREDEVEGPSERKFGLTMAVVFLLLTAVWAWRGRSYYWPESLAVALVFTGVATFAPVWLAPLNRLWLRFGLVLHKVISPFVLMALFFLVVTPVGAIARLTGKDFLRLKFDPKADTYWVERRPPGPRPKSMHNQF